MDAVDFLGHRVRAEGLQPREEKLAVVRKLPTLIDLAILRSALSLFSDYRKFVKGFSTIASPLHQLLQKGAP